MAYVRRTQLDGTRDRSEDLTFHSWPPSRRPTWPSISIEIPTWPTQGPSNNLQIQPHNAGGGESSCWWPASLSTLSRHTRRAVNNHRYCGASSLEVRPACPAHWTLYILLVVPPHASRGTSPTSSPGTEPTCRRLPPSPAKKLWLSHPRDECHSHQRTVWWTPRPSGGDRGRRTPKEEPRPSTKPPVDIAASRCQGHERR